MTAVVIVSVFPELLGTYGDVGNVAVLERRLAWRGIAVKTVAVHAGDTLLHRGDLYVFGGGEDASQLAALRALRASRLPGHISAGANVFAVCAGLQLLGTSLVGPEDRDVEGLGLLDVRTTRLDRRVVGEVLAQVTQPGLTTALTGFANHGCGTTLGPGVTPLGIVRTGLGNEGSTKGAEGAVNDNIVSTYLHGPVLARNPALADWILTRALGVDLVPLPEGPPEALHARLSDPRISERRSVPTAASSPPPVLLRTNLNRT